MSRFELIEESIVEGKRLGRNIHHDPRSRNYRARTATDLISVQHPHVGPVLNQGQTGSCTGHALAQCLNVYPLKWSCQGLKTHDDAMWLYQRATQTDSFPGSYPPDDTGSDGLDVCKAAVERNFITEYTHTFSLDEALHALVLSPIITGVSWYNTWDTPDANGFVSIGNGTVRGGHEFCVVGLDVNAKTVQALNSWGPTFGHGGFFSFSWDDWNRLLSESGDCTVPVRY